MADDDKKRTQEGSETNFTTRGGRQDEVSGAGKPQTSPCKRGPGAAPPADAFHVNFKNDGEDGGWHVRLGPSPREAYEATGFCNPMFKGGGVLAFIDQLFWLAETTQKATH